MYDQRLKKSDWEVKTVELSVCQDLVSKHHYAKGGSNTATARHGLFRIGAAECLGVAWWIPPTKAAAMATFPENWQGVLCLSRLVVCPGVPKNACSFMLARSMRMIDRRRWPCFVTYADEWQNHTGTIYRASNWTEVGRTKPEATFTINGVMTSRKAGPRTYTRSEMIEGGAVLVGKFSKIKFVHISGKAPAARHSPAS